MLRRLPFGRAGAVPLLFALCVVAVLGCKKKQPPPPPANDQPAEPKSEAKLTADALHNDIDKYKGKWVTVIARVQKVITSEHDDKHVELSAQLQGEHGRPGCAAEMEFKDASHVPKFEDGARYEFFGQVSGSKDTGATLKQCKFLGASKDEGPAPEATVTAEELTKEAAKYKDKLIQVRGVVRTGTLSPTGGEITLTGEGNKFVTCVLAAGQFEKVVKSGRGATVEVKGIVTDVERSVKMNKCTLEKFPQGGAIALKAMDFTRDFTRKKDAAEEYKNKYVTVAGTVQSAADGKLVITGYWDPKNKKVVPQKIVATFAPDWKDALAKVKVGENVTVSGEFSSYTVTSGEVSLNDCWLVPQK